MSSSAQFLRPSEAARRLGVSAKALRVYEQRGLVSPPRTAAGWRAYGPDDMARAAEIVALRALGFSLAQVAGVLRGDPQDLCEALAAQEATLASRMRRLAGTLETLRRLRDQGGRMPATGNLAGLLAPAPEVVVAFDLPWPWGGERFELRDLRPLNYIVGPLGSGKTRFARRLAETLPDAAFLGLERLSERGAALRARLDADPGLEARVGQALVRLVDGGAEASDALIALLARLEGEDPAILVVDMIEQGLDAAAQEAMIAYLRGRGPGERPLFLTTRSSVILDLETVGTGEAVLLCPANHGPPTQVHPVPGASGYEAVATCLATPDVRTRTEGVVALRTQAK